MNFEQEKTEINAPSSQPIVMVIIIIALSAACFYYFNQQIKESIQTMLIDSSDIIFEIPPVPKIDFAFLKSDEFNELERFPDYDSFKPSESISSIQVGRSNPFVPFGGFAPVIEETPQVQEAAIIEEVKTNENQDAVND